jgi:hypothetical protein
VVAGVVVVVVILGLVGWVWAGRDRGGGDGDASPADPGPCPRPGDSWQPIELTADPTSELTDAVGRSFELTVEDARYRARGSDVQIVVALSLYNTTPPEEDGAFYVGAGDFGEMFVDEASIGPRTCFSASPQNVDTGVSSELLVGFNGAYEPGSSLVIETTIADRDVTVADG